MSDDTCVDCREQLDDCECDDQAWPATNHDNHEQRRLTMSNRFSNSIHIGVRADDLDWVREDLAQAGIGAVWAEGDGWEAWGDKPDVAENRNNPEARHIHVDTNDVETAVRRLRMRVGHRLVAMTSPHQSGVVLVVTTTDDYSVPVIPPVRDLRTLYPVD